MVVTKKKRLAARVGSNAGWRVLLILLIHFQLSKFKVSLRKLNSKNEISLYSHSSPHIDPSSSSSYDMNKGRWNRRRRTQTTHHITSHPTHDAIETK
jgi:hypothetical protein